MLAGSDRFYFGFIGVFFFDANNPNNFLYWYNPADDQWGVLGNDQTNGFTDDVLALATAPGGSAYAGGRFHFAGTERADYVARWNGTEWRPLGQGTDDVVEGLLYTSAGALYAGGRFSEAYQPDGTVMDVSRIARWDPVAEAWHAVGGGANGIVRAFAEAADGSVYVGGFFDEVYQEDGSVLDVESLARWRPETEVWETLPDGHGFDGVYSIAEDDIGALYVGGYRIIPTTFESRAFVARLDPETEGWTTLREWAFTLWVRALSVVGDPTTGGALYAGAYGDGVWQWKDGTWTGLGGPELVHSLALNGDPEAGGELYAGGVNRDESGPYVQRWDGESWSSLGSGLTSFVSPPLVHALAVGEAETEGQVALWVGGEFVTAGGEPASCIARWETKNLDTGSEDGGTALWALGLEAYPNPASGPVTLRYTLAAPGPVRLVVYDVLGRKVGVLVDEVQPAGTQEVLFERGGLAAGVYVVRIEAGEEVLTRRVTVLR